MEIEAETWVSGQDRIGDVAGARWREHATHTSFLEPQEEEELLGPIAALGSTQRPLLWPFTRQSVKTKRNGNINKNTRSHFASQVDGSASRKTVVNLSGYEVYREQRRWFRTNQSRIQRLIYYC